MRKALLSLLLLPVVVSFAACRQDDVDFQSQPTIEANTTLKIGAPCPPIEEEKPTFQGFGILEESIVSRFPVCGNGGVCLVNHFQGRVSCPFGQDAPKRCTAVGMGCFGGAVCVPVLIGAPSCDPSASAAEQAAQCSGAGACNAEGKFCECTPDSCPSDSECDENTKRCTVHVCHVRGSCQTADSTAADANKDCCVPLTDMPVVSAVCGQCAAASKRDAEDAVYCSCKCGPAEGAPPEDTAYCACPTGFECSEVRKYVVGVSDPFVGKYCIKPGTEYEAPSTCKPALGHDEKGVCSPY
jgi:hypothetical protein